MKWHNFRTELPSALHYKNRYEPRIIPWVGLRIVSVSGPQRAPIRISCYRSRSHQTGPKRCNTQSNSWTHTNIYPYTYTPLHMHTTYIHAYIYMQLKSYSHLNAHIIQAYLNKYPYTQLNLYPNTHRNTRTHTQTHALMKINAHLKTPTHLICTIIYTHII